MATPKSVFKDRLALITGGSSGIGLALAHRLASEGARVWILARRPEVLESAVQSLASENGNKPGMLVADVSDWDQVQAAVRRLQDEAGVPDLLINAAGVMHPGYVQDMPVEIFRQMIDIDYLGIVYMVKAVLPAMLQRGSGHIVNISSLAAYLTGPGYGAYSPAKYAVRGFSDALRAEAKPYGVRVSIVFPPDTDTPQLAYQKRHNTPELQQISDATGLGPFKVGVFSPEQVARDILGGVKRGTYMILPGTMNKVLYRTLGLIGNLVYPLTDDEWAAARRKHGKA